MDGCVDIREQICTWLAARLMLHVACPSLHTVCAAAAAAVAAAAAAAAATAAAAAAAAE